MKKIITMVALVMLLVVSVLMSGCETKYTSEEVQVMVNNAVSKSIIEQDIKLDNAIAELSESYEQKLNEQKKSFEAIIADKDKEIENLSIIEEPVIEDEIIVTKPAYYTEDVSLTGNYNMILDNEDLESLYFKSVKYDNEDYDIEEILKLSSNIKPTIDMYKDFGSDVMIEITEEGAIEYYISFDPAIVIDKDFTISFLGKDMILSNREECDDDEIILRTSDKYVMSIGDSVEVDNKTITLMGIDEDENSILVKIDDHIETIEDSETVNELDFKINKIFVSSVNDFNMIELYIGEDIKETIKSEDEFEDDDRYEWIIEADSEGISKIGVKLVETYVEDDEVLALEDTISLPYDYKVISFDSIKNLKINDLDISVRSDEIKVSSDDKIEILDKKIDGAVFYIKDNGTNYYVEYEYRGDELFAGLSDVVIFSEDREINIDYVNDSSIVIDDVYVFDYAFTVKDITSATGYDEDEDVRKSNGDILYQSDVNEDDETVTSIKLGLATDEDIDVILKIE